MIKKAIFLFIFWGILFFPLMSLAQAPLVTCGHDENADGVIDDNEMCQLCDFFVLFERIIDFIMITLAPVIAVLMIVVGGAMFIIAGLGPLDQGGPTLSNQGRRIITTAIFGLVIIYGAWIVINTFLLIIGVAAWTGLAGGWFTITCP